jgi:hypothetical protein
LAAIPKLRQQAATPNLHFRRNLVVLIVVGFFLIMFFAPAFSEAVDSYKTPRGYSVFANVSPSYFLFKCGMIWGFEGRISIDYPGQPAYRLPNNTQGWQLSCG